MMLSLFIGAKFSRAKQRNQLVSFISLSSMIGIAVGVAVIIIGLSAMNGFEHELENRVLAVVPQAEIKAVNGPVANWQESIAIAERNSNVTAAAPYLSFVALVERGSQLKAVEVRAVDPQKESQVSDLYKYIDPSVWKNFKAGSQQIIVGQGVADKLNVGVGDGISVLIPPEGAKDAAKISSPKRVRLKVAGLLSLGGKIDHNLVLIPLKDGQQYLDLQDQVSGIALKVNNVFDADLIVQDVGMTIPFYSRATSWKSNSNGSDYNDIQLVRTIMYLVMVLVIGVASFNVVSTLMMAVKDRASDIAILRTMGASDGLIRGIFVWYGVFSGVLGSIIGSIVGVVIALNLTTIVKGIESLTGHHFLSGDIYFINFLPSQVQFADVFLVSGTAITLSLLATWYPSTRASNLNPATVLSSK